MKEQSSANLGLEALPACDVTRAAEKISGMKMHSFFYWTTFREPVKNYLADFFR